MDNQTENYIVLKPIAERFNRIANEISDDEIKSLIKSELGNQLKQIDFSTTIQEWFDDYLENDCEDIMNMLKNHLANKLR